MVMWSAATVSRCRLIASRKLLFEVNGGLLMALLLALLMLVCIIQRLATGDRLMSFYRRA
uniref:hypothetical protein n=1 Tax=Escherichia coli TaxID=562 RepID=UPI001F30EDBC|nr:hypothetical protein [Escherichia coli]